MWLLQLPRQFLWLATSDYTVVNNSGKYIFGFWHYYEPTINGKVMTVVQDYAMYRHFSDIKQVYVTGLLKALREYDADRGVLFIVL